jgi:ABC-type polysaccharide/polyol phosphate transport system ATPase subunit
MKLKHYSTGMRVRLAFSTSLQVNPDILLVDEVLSVGDMSFQKKSFDAFLSFKNENKTILFTSHNLQIISKISDHVLLMNNGELLMEGKPDDMIRLFMELSNKD